MCKICEKNPVYEFTNQRKICRNCFISYFQKKAFYISRKFEMIKQGDIIFHKEGKDFRGVVLKNILELFEKKSVITISNEKYNKIAISNTLDMESNKIITNAVKGKINLKKILPIEKIKNKLLIKPLYLFLDEEVFLYAKLKNLKFNKETLRKDKINLFIDNLEKKHPEIKRAIVNWGLKIG